MPEMFCCTSRMRIERNGVALVFFEQTPRGDIGAQWRACKIYESDRWICPECKRWVHTGLGQRPIMQRYEDDVKFDNYLADLIDGKMMDMLGRAQPHVDIYE